mgnify:CR=1 FL=1
MHKKIVEKLIEYKIPLPVALFWNIDRKNLLNFLSTEEYEYLTKIDNEITIAKYYFCCNDYPDCLVN